MHFGAGAGFVFFAFAWVLELVPLVIMFVVFRKANPNTYLGDCEEQYEEPLNPDGNRDNGVDGYGSTHYGVVQRDVANDSQQNAYSRA